jgi:hypothetical protein
MSDDRYHGLLVAVIRIEEKPITAKRPVVPN